MGQKKKLRIVPLEERILLDAAVAAVVANAVTPADGHASVGHSDASSPAPAQATPAAESVQSTQPTTPVIYVNVNAKGSVHDGQSWATAYVSLQDALNKAAQTPGADQIWVAKGTYLPTQIYSPDGVTGGASGLNDPHLKTFNIPDNVSIYGGFKSGMTSLSQANSNLYPTILSGDLLGNDINNPSNPNYVLSKADNAWHVVTLGNDVTQQGVTATLSGLTIIDGYANGPSGTPTFTPFVYNHNFGGGAYAFNSTVTFINDVFQYNYAASDGGGIFTNNADITVQNSTFLNNSAVIRGGGLESLSTFEGDTPHTANIINSYFKDNTSQVFGGAIVSEGTFANLASAMNIRNSTFVHNLAPEGGAITVDSLTTNIDHSIFTNNVAYVNGGAIATTNIVNSIVGGPSSFVTTVTDSTFLNNIAQGDAAAHEALNNFLGGPIGINFATGGGAITTYVNGHLVVNDSLFVGNTAQRGDGGAILNGDSSGDNVFGTGLTSQHVTTDISGSTFINNRSLTGNGGAIASETDHILPPNAADISLSIKNSSLLNNYAKGDGGGIYADTSTLADAKNVFLANRAGNLGDQLYAIASDLNGVASSSPLAYVNQVLSNKFLLLDNEDLYLA